MPRPYSIDLRIRVIEKHQAGKTVGEIANEFALIRALWITLLKEFLKDKYLSKLK